jgi:hypothetical protein
MMRSTWSQSRQSRTTVRAHPVAESERGDNQVALAQVLHLGTRLLHHADELVPVRAAESDEHALPALGWGWPSLLSRPRSAARPFEAWSLGVYQRVDASPLDGRDCLDDAAILILIE